MKETDCTNTPIAHVVLMYESKGMNKRTLLLVMPWPVSLGYLHCTAAFVYAFPCQRMQKGDPPNEVGSSQPAFCVALAHLNPPQAPCQKQARSSRVPRRIGRGKGPKPISGKSTIAEEVQYNPKHLGRGRRGLCSI